MEYPAIALFYVKVKFVLNEITYKWEMCNAGGPLKIIESCCHHF